MPADRLTATDPIEAAIARVVTGMPLADAAAEAKLPAADLADAVEVYRQAGLRALDQRDDPGWWQIYIRFIDWDWAERIATDHLAPLLEQAEADSVIAGWWFIRKHPCWRLRLRPGPEGNDIEATLGGSLDQLVTEGAIDAWWPGIYEAETAAFGGSPGIDIAHDLFCADSRAIIATLVDDQMALGRRELSILLCGTLMRAAGLEWYEQGDVWHRITQERPPPTHVSADRPTTVTSDIKKLLLADTTPDGSLLGEDGPLASAANWIEPFRYAGEALGAANRQGTLHRGLREVVSYLVIFHWNRLGLDIRTQSILASAARSAILGAHSASRSS